MTLRPPDDEELDVPFVDDTLELLLCPLLLVLLLVFDCVLLVRVTVKFVPDDLLSLVQVRGVPLSGYCATGIYIVYPPILYELFPA